MALFPRRPSMSSLRLVVVVCLLPLLVNAHPQRALLRALQSNFMVGLDTRCMVQGDDIVVAFTDQQDTDKVAWVGVYPVDFLHPSQEPLLWVRDTVVDTYYGMVVPRLIDSILPVHCTALALYRPLLYHCGLCCSLLICKLLCLPCAYLPILFSCCSLPYYTYIKALVLWKSRLFLAHALWQNILYPHGRI